MPRTTGGRAIAVRRSRARASRRSLRARMSGSPSRNARDADAARATACRAARARHLARRAAERDGAARGKRSMRLDGAAPRRARAAHDTTALDIAEEHAGRPARRARGRSRMCVSWMRAVRVVLAATQSAQRRRGSASLPPPPPVSPTVVHAERARTPRRRAGRSASCRWSRSRSRRRRRGRGPRPACAKTSS